MEKLKDKPNSKRAVKSLKAKYSLKRTWSDVVADWLASGFGTVIFLILNITVFAVWIIWNTSAHAFDPFPFGLLTTIVSLEAIVLSIVVLISQNRAAKIDELRQEMDLELDTISEKEITKIIQMLSKIMKHYHLDVSNDAALKTMLKPTNVDKIEEDLNNQL